MKLISLGSYIAILAAILSWTNSVSAQAKEAKITVTQEDAKTILAKAGERKVFEYRYQESPKKAYLRQLWSPGGVQILRDSPHDHVHHHALMFALKADGVDFWSEQPNNGQQKSLAVESLDTKVRDEVCEASFKQKLAWVDPQTDKPVMEEVRQVKTYLAPQLNATLVSWHTTLEPAKGKETVELGGDHYFGLGMRFVTSMDEAGEFLYADNKEGESVRGSEKLTAARWCAYRSKADGKPVTVAMFDSPKNPRHPNKFFTMRPFAYLAATLNLWKEPMTLKAGQPLRLTYGVAVWDGHIEPAEIEKTYQQWLKLEKK